jgi:hypothetical protein
MPCAVIANVVVHGVEHVGMKMNSPSPSSLITRPPAGMCSAAIAPKCSTKASAARSPRSAVNAVNPARSAKTIAPARRCGELTRS